nr:hypothetical protein [uncultured Lichenicoccus sp.]
MADSTARPATALPHSDAAPAPQALETETDPDRLHRLLAGVEAELREHRLALSRLQGELAASRLEVAGARGETMVYRAMVQRAQAELAEAELAQAGLAGQAADVAGQDAEIARLHAIIAAQHSEMQSLGTAIVALYASFSWRVSRPVRVASRSIRRILRAPAAVRRLVRRVPTAPDHAGAAASPQESPPASAPPPAPPPGMVDPNAGHVFQAAPMAEAGPAEPDRVVTLDALYHLSRSL